MTYTKQYISYMQHEGQRLMKSIDPFERGMGRGMLLAIEKFEKGERLDRATRRIARAIKQNNKNQRTLME